MHTYTHMLTAKKKLLKNGGLLEKHVKNVRRASIKGVVNFKTVNTFRKFTVTNDVFIKKTNNNQIKKKRKCQCQLEEREPFGKSLSDEEKFVSERILKTCETDFSFKYPNIYTQMGKKIEFMCLFLTQPGL